MARTIQGVVWTVEIQSFDVANEGHIGVTSSSWPVVVEELKERCK